ncbi:4-alpha-glucanotransferase [Aerococcaceae bacterium NML191292]|nr:4-alpha-glucanotransferase [Aerococcaceae bacterium NML191292]
MERSSGVLLHISSLPNEIGIGTFGESAYRFVDFLVESGQRYWQILPLGTTSYGDSPYQSFSAFAGNTHFIDFDLLAQAGLLEEADFKGVDFGSHPEYVDYARIFEARRPILEKAVRNFLAQSANKEAYDFFVADNALWLEPFCEYMAIKEHFGLRPWYEWDEAARLREEAALAHYHQLLAEQMMYHRVTQYFFNQQWLALKEYANAHHIEIIGDMPIYVAEDSVEMWMTPQYFKTDENHRSTVIAGCPPDAFTADGQLWGNPIYDWDYMKQDHYQWWVQRIKESLKLYDVVRIDHFRGFESYWEIPAGDETAVNGQWVQGPSSALFRQIKKELGEVKIIAEDLGFMTDEVIAMRDETGFPGMKILQFGFGENDSADLPHHYVENSIAYVGTHDNETGLGWYQDSASEAARQHFNKYLNRSEDESVSHALNRGIAASVSKIAIYTMQDLLDLDNSARMNIPSTLGGNWQWRMKADAITPEVTDSLRDLTEVYFRMNLTNTK